MMLVRKVYNCYNKNIYQYIIKEIILIKKCLKTTNLLKLINQYNAPHQCTSSTLSINNKNHIKISTNPIVLSLLFYCYYSIVKPLWLLHSQLKTIFTEVLLNSTTTPISKSTYDVEISKDKYSMLFKTKTGVFILFRCLARWCSYSVLSAYRILIEQLYWCYVLVLCLCYVNDKK